MSPPILADPLRLRVLLMLAKGRDAQLTHDLLGQQGIHAEVCADAAALRLELQRGAGAVVVAEEMLGTAQPVLGYAVEQQPQWSDLPVLVLSLGGADSVEVGDAIALLGNVIVLERPLRVAALISSVRAALRARYRQYEIEEHLRQLEQARDAQAVYARRKDEFLAMLAHELRNPLAPIRNALYVMARDDGNVARRAQLRLMMERQVDHMVRLVDDLLEASRLSRGMITLHREPLDLRDALRSAVDLSRPLIDAGSCRLRMVLPDAPLLIDADPIRIAQVFGNLLNNAARYGCTGGHITVTAQRDGNAALVTVEDDGSGIEAEVLPHVFELFVQGTREHDSPQQGLGIGLALVRSLVEMHGGKVDAYSEGRGRGACFTVRLPLAQPVQRPVAPAPVVESLHGLRVLVVDDNVDAAQSLAMVLDTLGMEHAVVHDGPSALRLVDDFQPDAVLLDIGMRGMDGYEVARQLRRNPRNTDILLIAVTGWSNAPDLKRSREAGIDHHLPKPVDIPQLKTLLAQKVPVS